MKLTELTRDNLIETIAATLFRVTGFEYAVSAVNYFWHFEFYRQMSLPIGHLSSTAQAYLGDAIWHALIAVVMLCLSVSLARLVCRGLNVALDFKPSAEIN
jgi:uncharacterized membrane protein